jgi:hypothetical protein
MSKHYFLLLSQWNYDGDWMTMVWFRGAAATTTTTFTTMLRLALGPIQPPVQWVGGVKWWKHKTDYWHQPSAEIKNVWSLTSIIPYTFMAGCFSHGTTLPSPYAIKKSKGALLLSAKQDLNHIFQNQCKHPYSMILWCDKYCDHRQRSW